MKKPLIFFPILIFVMVGLTSCQELDNLTQFDLEYTTTITVPSSTGLNLPFDLFSPDITTNSEAEFAIHDTRKDLLEEVNLTEMTLTITSPNTQRFDFLKSISIYLRAEGLSEIKIAYKYDVPENIGNELMLEVNGNDLKEYIKADRFSLRVETVTDEFLSNNVKIDLYSQFAVDATLLPQ